MAQRRAHTTGAWGARTIRRAPTVPSVQAAAVIGAAARPGAGWDIAPDAVAAGAAGRRRTARVLADLVTGTRLREAAVVLAGTVALALAAQVAIPLPFTPVPLSLATLVVLLGGAALGPVRAGASFGLYAVLGVLGVPVFAGGGTGWAFGSFGYVLGYVAAGVLVGWLAARGADRRWWSAALIGLAGTAVVYALGLAWMVPWLGLSVREAWVMGVAPFLIGDALKIAVIAGVLPLTWQIARPHHP